MVSVHGLKNHTKIPYQSVNWLMRFYQPFLARGRVKLRMPDSVTVTCEILRISFSRASYRRLRMIDVRVRYQTIEFGDTDIHLKTLRDRNEFQDAVQEAESLGVSPSSWPLFGVVWESGEILARLMQFHNIDQLKVLEVGCGIGLASVMLSTRHADITATDYNPAAGPFLVANAALNELGPITFVREGWADTQSALGQFDLIIGSDLLYEQDNVELLAGFIERHSKPVCSVIIVDPGRGLRAKFTKRMVAGGYTHESTVAVTPEISTTYTGKVMTFSRLKTADGVVVSGG